MLVAIAGIQHETNTFSDQPTTLADFQRDSACGPEFQAGDFLQAMYHNTGTIHGGFLDAAAAEELELRLLLNARAQPAGIVQQTAYDELLGLILERLAAAMPVDGVALDLHGAMVTEAHEDAESEIVAAVRQAIGVDVPLAVTLDLHANVGERMTREADIVVGFDTYPHVDMRQRGCEALTLLARNVRGEIRPRLAFRQLPLMTLPPRQCTLREPMQSLMRRVHEMESEPGVLTATVSMGFPYADIHDVGVSVMVTTDGDEQLAESKVDELAGWLWELGDALQPELTPIDELLAHAEQHPGPTIYADGSDNPGGGAPCDGTVILQALVDREFAGAVVGILFDPDSVAQAHAAGVGATIDARVGGKTDDRHGAPVACPAYVKTLSDGRFVHSGPMRQGLPGDFGRMAVLVTGGVEVVVAERRMQLLDREMLRVVGVTPEHKRLIVVKSAVHFRADFTSIATGGIFDADTPGIHRPDFAAFEYKKVRRPIYPLDDESRVES